MRNGPVQPVNIRTTSLELSKRYLGFAPYARITCNHFASRSSERVGIHAAQFLAMVRHHPFKHYSSLLIFGVMEALHGALGATSKLSYTLQPSANMSCIHGLSGQLFMKQPTPHIWVPAIYDLSKLHLYLTKPPSSQTKLLQQPCVGSSQQSTSAATLTTRSLFVTNSLQVPIAVHLRASS